MGRPGASSAGRLVRRLRRRHQEQAIEGERLADFVGDEEMAEVDRVERSTEDAERAAAGGYSRICPSPHTTNLVVVSSRTPTGPRA